MLDAGGHLVELTPGVIDDEADWAYMHGQCLALAVAVSRRTGWPVVTTTIEETEPDAEQPDGYFHQRLLRHAAVRTPEGDLLDIRGPGDPDVIETYEGERQDTWPAERLDELLAEHQGFLEEQNLEAAETFVDPVLKLRDDELASGPRISRAHGADLPKVAFVHPNPLDPSLIGTIRNDGHTKPIGGLWLSPVGADGRTAWQSWCAGEDYDPYRGKPARAHRVELRPDARVAKIDSAADLDALAGAYPAQDRSPLNFEALAGDFDAVWLTDRGQWATRFRDGDLRDIGGSAPNLYGWDIESVLVLNKDALDLGGAG